MGVLVCHDRYMIPILSGYYVKVTVTWSMKSFSAQLLETW